MTIQKLPLEVAMKIAAGEVIERPVSVVKELLENSIDAGSKKIVLDMVQGGKTAILIEDDGDGIPFEQMPLAIESHATSKISDIDDLERLATLGYRGEALSSISSVSRLDIRSKTEQADKGGLLQAEAGKITCCTPANTRKGTRIQVRELFFNLPARRKFLKSRISEFRRISRLVQDYALAYPAVSFNLKHEGKQVFVSSGNGDRGGILERIWGREPEIKTSESKNKNIQVKIWWQKGPIGGRLNPTFFVNGRRISDGTLRAAISAGEWESSGNWFLFLSIPSAEVDVNIHPAKAEVRFHHSGEVFDAVRIAVEGLVGQIRKMPLNKPSFQPSFHLNSQSSGERTYRGGSAETAWKKNMGGSLFARVSEPKVNVSVRREIPPKEPLMRTTLETDEEIRFISRLSSGYLMFEDKESVVIVDPHAAHERVRFEMLRNWAMAGIRTQGLTVPLNLPPTLSRSIEEHSDKLSKLGFCVQFSEGVCQLIALPGMPGGWNVSPLELLRVTLNALDKMDDGNLEEAVWKNWATEACRGATKITSYVSSEEALHLWHNLFKCEHPLVCPHGRPTVLKLTNNDMEKHFGRKG